MNKCFNNRIAMFTSRGWFDIHFTKELIGRKDVMQGFELKAYLFSVVILKGSSYTELGEKFCLIKLISVTGGQKDFSASSRHTRLADTFCIIYEVSGSLVSA